MINIKSINAVDTDIYADNRVILRKREGVSVVFDIGDIKDCTVYIEGKIRMNEDEIQTIIEGLVMSTLDKLIHKG